MLLKDGITVCVGESVIELAPFLGRGGGEGAQQPPVLQGLIQEVSRSNTMTHHSRYDSSG